MNIFCDIDDTLLNFIPTLLEVYNADYNDNLTKDDITDWQLDLFVKPECGVKIYDYFSDPNLNLYYAIKPIKNSLNIINLLKKNNHRIIFCTRLDPFNRKLNWLVENGFTKDSKDYVLAEDKTLLDAYVIIDDRFKYIQEYNESHRKAILINQPWNKKYDYVYRAYNWNDVLNFIKEWENQ